MAAVTDNVWDAAIAAGRDQEMSVGPEETTLVVLGSRGSGKTTLMQHVVLEKSEVVKPTLALDYTYGRRDNSNVNLGKDVCHLWELGGGTALTNLLESPFGKLDKLHVVIVVDLADASRMWDTLHNLINEMNRHVHKVCSEHQGMENRLRAQLEQRMENLDEEEKSRLKPLLVPLTIVGSKYDLFKDLETEQKKSICRALRFLAHIHGANLVFYSSKESGLSRRMRSLMTSLMFNEAINLSMNTDISRPLTVPSFTDNLSSLSTSVETMRANFVSLFPQVEMQTEVPDDPTQDPVFNEVAIDNRRAIRDDELQRYRREAERRRIQRARV